MVYALVWVGLPLGFMMEVLTPPSTEDRLMKFGYFFIGMHFTSEGAAFSQVQIRPMERGNLQDAGMCIDIRVPVRTEDYGSLLSAIATQALQSVAQLLPESALSSWAHGLDFPVMAQPCLPLDTLDNWNRVSF